MPVVFASQQGSTQESIQMKHAMGLLSAPAWLWIVGRLCSLWPYIKETLPLIRIVKAVQKLHAVCLVSPSFCFSWLDLHPALRHQAPSNIAMPLHLQRHLHIQPASSSTPQADSANGNRTDPLEAQHRRKLNRPLRGVQDTSRRALFGLGKHKSADR